MKQKEKKSNWQTEESKFLELNSQNNQKLESSKINTDFNLLLKLIKELAIYLITLPLNLLKLLLIPFLKEKENNLLKKLFLEPFRLFNIFKDWLLEAKYTTLLIFTLIISYIIEIIYLIPNKLLPLFMNHPKYLTNKVYTLLTSVFLHANIIHLTTNLIALLIFGRIVERDLDWKVVPIFIFSGIIANIISDLISIKLNDIFFSLGASGAIASLIMIAILLHPFALTSIAIIPVPICLLGWLLIYADVNNLTTQTHINHFAHLGGYLAILIIIFFLEWKERKKIIKGLILNLVLLMITYLISKNINIKDFIHKIYIVSSKK